jgi:NAD(P)H dehydrogenase (quinone)
MGDARTAYIDVRDVAAVAATALAGGHDGTTYELHGPEGLTCAEIARKVSEHAGVAARFVDIPVEDQQKAMLAQGMPEWQVTALLDLQAYYTGGRGGTPDRTVERLLGRSARTIDAFLAENAAAFRG